MEEEDSQEYGPPPPASRKRDRTTTEDDSEEQLEEASRSKDAKLEDKAALLRRKLQEAKVRSLRMPRSFFRRSFVRSKSTSSPFLSLLLPSSRRPSRPSPPGRSTLQTLLSLNTHIQAQTYFYTTLTSLSFRTQPPRSSPEPTLHPPFHSHHHPLPPLPPFQTHPSSAQPVPNLTLNGRYPPDPSRTRA